MTDALTPWTSLRRFTHARIALGRVGNGQPTEAHLAFQADHAAARDAVHAALDMPALLATLPQAHVVTSACPDRRTYLLRPDLGRRLSDASRIALAAAATPGALVIVIGDGLSATAAQRHAAPLVTALHAALGGGPVVVAQQARVALGDDIGAAMGAEAVLMLLGERPGLSSPDSLGAYLTWQPRLGRTDAERNCVSNIRPAGLPVDQAAAKLVWLIRAMRAARLTGVDLKDEMPLLAGGQTGRLPTS